MPKNYDEVSKTLQKMGYCEVGRKAGASIFKFTDKSTGVEPLKRTLKVPFTIAKGNQLDKILKKAGFKAFQAREYGHKRRRQKQLSQAYRQAVRIVENATVSNPSQKPQF